MTSVSTTGSMAGQYLADPQQTSRWAKALVAVLAVHLAVAIVAAYWQGAAVVQPKPDMSIALDLAPLPVADQPKAAATAEAPAAAPRPVPQERPTPVERPQPVVQPETPSPIVAPPVALPVPVAVAAAAASGPSAPAEAGSGGAAGASATDSADRAGTNRAPAAGAVSEAAAMRRRRGAAAFWPISIGTSATRRPPK